MRNCSKLKRRTMVARDGHIFEYEESSGNVFADLGLPNPELLLAKAELVQRIRRVIADRKLTQSAAGKLMGIDQPKVSALLRGGMEGYTIDRLLRFLNALGQDVEIVVMPAKKKSTRSGIRVRA